jgi:hypothetical protein
MRTRREFMPVLDCMPSRIAPSATGAVIAISILPGVATQGGAGMLIASPGGARGITMQSDSSTIIAGEPSGSGSGNC